MLSCLLPTLRIYRCLHHTISPTTQNNQHGNYIIISLLNLVVLSSNRCLVPVRFSISVEVPAPVPVVVPDPDSC